MASKLAASSVASVIKKPPMPLEPEFSDEEIPSEPGEDIEF